MLYMRAVVLYLSIKALYRYFMLFLLAVAPIAVAKPEQVKAPEQQVPLEQQRYHYEMAKTALSKGNWQQFTSHYQRLGDYTLTPYLDYALIKYNLHKLEFSGIDKFIQNHKGSFLETRLREQLLYTLAVKKRWKTYLNYYEPSLSSVELDCYWLYARTFERDLDALNEVAEIWQKGHSHPKACDPLFNRWRRAGGLTQEIAWNRFHNAMKDGNTGLARYVSSFLDDEHTTYAELYMRVHGYPHMLRKQRTFAEQSLPMQQIIAHGIQRYARKSPEEALKLWVGYEAQQLFPTELSSETKLYLATRLIRKGKTDTAAAMIANSHELKQNNVIHALVRESLKTQSWDKVLHWLNALSEQERSQDRWQYWRARAMGELALVDRDHGSPEQIYLKLANNRSFYGFLSSDRMGKSYSLEHIPVEISPSSLQTMEALPGLKRARELWLKGNFGEAQAEWIFTTRHMGSDDLVAAGELARRWGWYNKGINAMISGNLWDYLSIRFPLAYEDEVHQMSSLTSVTPDLIFAVARQESAFAENARSSAGAMGLMQLMPATAKSTARKNGIKHRKQDLFDPVHNIRLGSFYLNQLLDQYNGNRILAAAAYNAGPHRVDRWVGKNPQDVAFDIWIETIPFKETRGYVQNVLSFSVIYGYRMGKPRNLVSELEANSLL